MAALVGLAAGPALADWDHPIKWDQLEPIDTFGGASWIDNDTPSDALTADDFFCGGDLPWITDVKFHGWSTYGDEYIDRFRITFWTDVPATPYDESHPGELLYDGEFTDWFIDGNGAYQINIPQDMWFYQGTEDRILWIGIQGVMVDDGYADSFYWNFRDRYQDIWGDDAAFTSEYFGYPPWAHWGFGPDYSDPGLYEGLLPDGWTSADMSFRLTGIPEPASLSLLALGALVLIRRR